MVWENRRDTGPPVVPEDLQGRGSVPVRRPWVDGGSVWADRYVGPNTVRRGRHHVQTHRCAAGSAQQRADVPRAWLPPAKFRNGIWGVSHGHRPLRGDGEVSATARASGAQRSVCASGRKGWAGIGAGITPKGAINLGQSLSQPAADSSLYTREPWDGDADCRVGPAGLLAMTTVFCHSEAGAHTGRGNPSFYDGRGCGPPRSSAPTESPINHPSQPARSEAPAPAAARNGRESALEPSKRNKLPRLPGQRLAKRKARKEQLVKFGFCPMTSECSTAHNVRKSQQSPARAPVGITSTEQDRLEPRPAARQGAPRP